MKRRYRSRTDIVAQILESANGEDTTKTKIMYSAFLSHVQLKEYLSVLLENGLLEHDSKTNTYRTTDKGIKFLKLYEKMDNITNEVEVKSEKVL